MGPLQLATGDSQALSAAVDSVLAALDGTLATLRDSPWTPTAAAALALGIGFVLCFAGARIARPALIAASAVVGAVAVGSIAETWDAEPMWLWMLGGVAIGAVTGAILFRVAVAGVIAVVLGLTAPAAAAVVQHIDVVPPRPTITTTGEALFLDGVPLEGETAAEASLRTETFSTVVVSRASAFGDAVAEEAALAWNALPEKDRMTLAGAALAGAILGLAIGFFFPGPSAAAVTSALGSAIALPAAFVLLQRTSGVPSWIPRDGLTIVGVWLAVTMVGALFQTATSARRRHRPRPAAATHAEPAPA